MRAAVPEGSAAMQDLLTTFSGKLVASQESYPGAAKSAFPEPPGSRGYDANYVPLVEEAGSKEDEDADNDDVAEDEEGEPTDEQLEAALVYPDDPDEANIKKLREMEYRLPPKTLLFGTQMLRALWVMTLSMAMYALYDVRHRLEPITRLPAPATARPSLFHA